MDVKNQRLWTEIDLAAYLGVSEQTVTRERKRGRLKFVRVAKKIRFTDAHIQEYLKSRECAPEFEKEEKPVLSIVRRS